MIVCSACENSHSFQIKGVDGKVMKTVTVFGTNASSKAKDKKTGIILPFAYTDIDVSDWEAVQAQYGSWNYLLTSKVIFADKSDAKTKERSYDEEFQATPRGTEQVELKDLTPGTAVTGRN